MKKTIQRAAEVVSDPLLHLSLAAGDGLALFVLGLTVGSIVTKIVLPRILCWVI